MPSGSRSPSPADDNDASGDGGSDRRRNMFQWDSDKQFGARPSLGDDSGSGSAAAEAAAASTGPRRRPSRVIGRRRESRRDVQKAISELAVGEEGWDRVAGAAALVAAESVAAGTQDPTSRRHKVGDRVLASLDVMNATLGGGVLSAPGYLASDGDEDSEAAAQQLVRVLLDAATVRPVNRHGYMRGGAPLGGPPEHHREPFGYVLAVVHRVHFDEDVPYYTVARADNHAHQRAEAGWMLPLTSEEGIRAAQGAAEINRRTLSEEAQVASPRASRLSRSFELGRYRAVTRYRAARLGAKVRLARLLYGDDPFSCTPRFSGVNFLVLCSAYYMFIDNLRLASFPAEADRSVMVVTTVVWMILVIELVFELLIRPKGYSSLILSEECFAPATARYINRFHIVLESASLLFFIPDLWCLASGGDCGAAPNFSMMRGTLRTVFGPTSVDVLMGHMYLITTRLRVFGLVRHWKKMWINDAIDAKPNGETEKKYVAPRIDVTEEKKKAVRSIFVDNAKEAQKLRRELERRKSLCDDPEDFDQEKSTEEIKLKEQKRRTRNQDNKLRKAATLNTALMVLNSHRAMVLIIASVGVLPLLYSTKRGGINKSAMNSLDILQANIEATDATSDVDCEYLDITINAWIASMATGDVNMGQYGSFVSENYTSLLWAQILPPICNIPNDGVITECREDTLFAMPSQSPSSLSVAPTTSPMPSTYPSTAPSKSPMTSTNPFKSITKSGDGPFCDIWGSIASLNEPLYEANTPWLPSGSFITGVSKIANIRSGAITLHQNQFVLNGTEFIVTALFNDEASVVYANLSSFVLQVLMMVVILFGLSLLRGDALTLVISPLRQMLRIVLRYASNPLASHQDLLPKDRSRNSYFESDRTVDSESEMGSASSGNTELGNYETEQLINAISKITDLLRKCWGIAGADIISTNLARTTDGKTVVFNPTVPGKRVYALFGFAGITDFSHLLMCLDKDIMMLINDVAKILHEETYRWALGDSGQCNKNLGAAFLMVYRIGDFEDVEAKKARASEVIFDTAEKKNSKLLSRRVRIGRSRYHKGRNLNEGTIQLATLPGIQAFTDRAVLGLLKTFAGLYRDQALITWTKDFRVGAGVDAFSFGLLFGMDAGWGVEGAVGSEFKIDATYLSPHVNMASRMMSACKQYGVNILLSQAVEELLSAKARSKLRHIDTVTVKGSVVQQRIFTYDARHQGVDFFLFGRSRDQADRDSENYSPSIWDTDQDLKAMRNHVSKEFEDSFAAGRQAYLDGEWGVAIRRLEEANKEVIQAVLDSGSYEYEAMDYEDKLLQPPTPQDDEVLIRLREEVSDGPCQSLLAYMKKHDGVAPDNWSGFRPLTSK